MRHRKAYYFFKFNLWAFIILFGWALIDICLVLILKQVISTSIICFILLIPTATAVYFSIEIFRLYPWKLKQLNQLIVMYDTYNRVPDSELYKMRCTKCGRLVEAQFEAETGYKPMLDRESNFYV